MARGRKTSLTITLTPEERQTLLAWRRATTIPLGLLRRARMILLLTDGLPITDIAARVGISRRFVYKWVQRFLEQGIDGLRFLSPFGDMALWNILASCIVLTYIPPYACVTNLM